LALFPLLFLFFISECNHASDSNRATPKSHADAPSSEFLEFMLEFSDLDEEGFELLLERGQQDIMQRKKKSKDTGDSKEDADDE